MAIESLFGLIFASAFLVGLAWYASTHRAEEKKKDTENLVLQDLKRIQTEQENSRDRDQEILSRLARIESGLAR